MIRKLFFLACLTTICITDKVSAANIGFDKPCPEVTAENLEDFYQYNCEKPLDLDGYLWQAYYDYGDGSESCAMIKTIHEESLKCGRPPFRITKHNPFYQKVSPICSYGVEWEGCDDGSSADGAFKIKRVN